MDVNALNFDEANGKASKDRWRKGAKQTGRYTVARFLAARKQRVSILFSTQVIPFHLSSSMSSNGSLDIVGL
jgi:hypothetical protein